MPKLEACLENLKALGRVNVTDPVKSLLKLEKIEDGKGNTVINACRDNLTTFFLYKSLVSSNTSLNFP